MAEPVLKRMQRIVAAGLESAADAAERINHPGMMRHAIREVDQAIDRLVRQQDAASARALQANKLATTVRAQVATLLGDARLAIARGRDDLARAAVARQIELEEEVARLGEARAQAEGEVRELEATIGELRARKQQMAQDYAALEAAKREVAAGGDAGIECKVRRAEEAFDRARAAAGVAAGRPSEVPAADVAALTAARREEEVAARLAGLRGMEPAAKAPRPRRPAA